jgi:sugar phosphate permease
MNQQKSSSADQPGTPKTFYGVYVAGTSMLIYFFTNGMLLFVPPNLYPRLMEEFQATAAEVSRTSVITHAVAAVLAPLVGYLVDRFGVIRVLRTGLILMAVCFTLYPFAQSLNQLYWLHGVLAVGLILAGLLTNVILLSRWFVKKRGRAIGLLVASSSVAGFLMPSLISPIVNNPQLGWRWGFGILAGLFWLIPVVLGWRVPKESPQDVGQYPDGALQPVDKEDPREPQGLTLAQAVRTRTLWCLAIGSGCLWFCINAMNSQATIFFELEAGLLPQRATFLYSLIFGFGALGKFLFGYLSDSIPKHRVMLMTSAILFIATLTLFEPGGAELPFQLTQSIPRLIAFAMLFGLGFGGSFTMIQVVAVESFGPRARGKILGIITLVDSMSGTLGTLVASALKTSTGSYLMPFAAVVVVALVAVVNVFFIKPVWAGNSAAET